MTSTNCVHPFGVSPCSVISGKRDDTDLSAAFILGFEDDTSVGVLWRSWAESVFEVPCCAQLEPSSSTASALTRTV